MSRGLMGAPRLQFTPETKLTAAELLLCADSQGGYPYTRNETGS